MGIQNMKSLTRWALLQRNDVTINRCVIGESPRIYQVGYRSYRIWHNRSIELAFLLRTLRNRYDGSNASYQNEVNREKPCEELR